MFYYISNNIYRITEGYHYTAHRNLLSVRRIYEHPVQVAQKFTRTAVSKYSITATLFEAILFELHCGIILKFLFAGLIRPFYSNKNIY